MKIIKKMTKRIITFMRIRSAIAEYKLAKSIYYAKIAKLDIKRIELENRIAAAQQREHEAEQIIGDLKSWAEQQIMSINRLHYYENRLSVIHKAVEANARRANHMVQ
jgi:hypothetical protein